MDGQNVSVKRARDDSDDDEDEEEAEQEENRAVTQPEWQSTSPPMRPITRDK